MDETLHPGSRRRRHDHLGAARARRAATRRSAAACASAIAHDSAARHVSGEAVYVDDIPELPGTLHVYVAMSERAHARIVSLDVSAVRQAPASPAC